TTKGVEAELNTRVLNLHVPDDRETTAKVVRATAARANGKAPEAPDVSAWCDLQTWLARSGQRQVNVPFAEKLGEAYPQDLVRARRDFTQLVTLIQAHAFLHQLQRGRDAEGRVLADRRDYEAVYALVDDLFGAIAAGGLTPAVRQAVEAVRDLLEQKRHA